MKKLVQEFREFAFRGNVIDMAVGVVIGSAFTSIVNDLFTPIIALITGSVDFTSLIITLAKAKMRLSSPSATSFRPWSTFCWLPCAYSYL